MPITEVSLDMMVVHSPVSMSAPRLMSSTPPIMLMTRMCRRRKLTADAAQPKRSATMISLWGVQQSTVDFYQVIRISPKTVVVRRVDARIVEIVGPMDAIVEAVPDAFRDEEQRRRPRIESGEWVVDVESWERATRWDGTPAHTVRYA